jgi:hypothetical protein
MEIGNKKIKKPFSICDDGDNFGEKFDEVCSIMLLLMMMLLCVEDEGREKNMNIVFVFNLFF